MHAPPTRLRSADVQPEAYHALASTVAAHPQWYARLDAPAMPEALAHLQPDQMREDLDQRRAGRTGTMHDDVVRQYADWKKRVAWTATQNASRLSTLLWAIRTLYTSGIQTRQLAELVAYVREQYGVRDIPASQQATDALVRRVSRQLDAQPKGWRGDL